MLQEMYSYLMYQKCFDHKNQADSLGISCYTLPWGESLIALHVLSVKCKFLHQEEMMK